MTTHDLTITLEVDRIAVVSQGLVALTARLSPALDALWKKPGSRIEIVFKAPSGVITRDPTDQTRASWRAATTAKGATGLATGTYRIKVKAKERKSSGGALMQLLDANGNPIEDKKYISVLVKPSITGITAKPAPIAEGGLVRLEAATSETSASLSTLGMNVHWDVNLKGSVSPDATDLRKADWDTTGLAPSIYPIKAALVDKNGVTLLDLKGGPVEVDTDVEVEPRPISRQDTLPVTLRRSAVPQTSDQALWVAIRNRTKAIAFGGSGYSDFINRVLCRQDPLPAGTPGRELLRRELNELGTSVYGGGAYELLKVATQIFLLLECGVVIRPTGVFDPDALFNPVEESGRLGQTVTLGEISDRLTEYLGSSGRLPYINRVLKVAFKDEPFTNRVHCFGVLGSKVQSPCLLELIWSYWHEEGMLVQTLGAISRRFQNIRGPGERDPLAHLEIDPLRPLNNLLWGYIQDEQNRLTLKRRAYEYDHHYGLTLYGKAVPTLRPADSRSKFFEGYHNLLHLCSVFYKEDNDTTVIADGFPLLNALKEVHLLLAQGAHNQFGDLPWTARAEMLIGQWLLARPEIRDFLQSRPMVPYREGWMPQVDTMKTLQGWSDVTVTHFRDLGVYGEQILLTIRYGDWIDADNEDSAKNWARYWRPEIQGYLHAYRAATGVDLTNPDTVDYTMPAVHLQKRLAMQRAR